jgi:hypothetical protein
MVSLSQIDDYITGKTPKQKKKHTGGDITPDKKVVSRLYDKDHIEKWKKNLELKKEESMLRDCTFQPMTNNKRWKSAMRNNFENTKDFSGISNFIEEDYEDVSHVSSHYDLNKTLGVMMSKLEQSKSKVPVVSSLK